MEEGDHLRRSRKLFVGFTGEVPFGGRDWKGPSYTMRRDPGILYESNTP